MSLEVDCPYEHGTRLREAWQRGLEAAQTGKSIDECSHRYFGGEPLLAFIEGYTQARILSDS